MQAVQDTLSTMLPHVKEPLICNAPMFGTATASLAAAVTKAGGFGFIGGGYDFTSSSAQLAVLDSELTRARELLNLPLENDQDKTASLPLGVGFLTFNASPDSEGLMELLHRHRPKGVWLFAPSNRRQHTALIAELKAVGESWDLKVFVQVGSVQSAIEAAQDGADILVVQGSDAGGHQFAAASSIITLVPEVSDMLREHGFKLPILAAGGIMDGRGMAAALALGANGVVMGTRFIATNEASAPEVVKGIMTSTKDGGVSTAKSAIHDAIQARHIWPAAYDGRAVINTSYREALSGERPLKDISVDADRASQEGDRSRMIVWAGAGVGLINGVLSAEDVVRQSQLDVHRIIKSLDALNRRMENE